MTSKMEHEDEFLALIDALRTFENEHRLGKRFNFFEAVNMTRQEIRHSRFLAFLLDPMESHGLDEHFLRAILLACAKAHQKSPISRLDLAIGNLSNARVYCERDHFDITIEVPELSLMVVIENKILASERTNQLSDYREKVKMRYPEFKFMGCFLTPEGYDGEDEQWGAMSYTTIAQELQRVTTEIAVSDDVSLSIRHYVELIERQIVTSQVLIEACRKIYKQHKLAIDLILEHASESVIGVAFQQFLAAHADLQLLNTRASRVHFQSGDWLKIQNFPRADTKLWESEFPVVFWFELGEKRLHLRLEVGPFHNDTEGVRQKFVNGLRQKLGVAQSQRNNTTYTRVLTLSEGVASDADSEECYNAMVKLWLQMVERKAVEKVREALAELMPQNIAA